MKPSSSSFWTWCFPSILFLSIVMVLLCPMRGLEAGDEGVVAMGGWRVLSGQVPGRDFFSIIPPMSFIAVACAYKLLGLTILAGRIAAAAYAFLLAVAAYLLIKKTVASDLLRSAAAAPLLSCGVASWLLPSHHWLADIPALLAIWLLWEKDGAPSSWFKLMLAGAASALCAMTLQDQGAILLLGLPVWIWITENKSGRFKAAGLFAAGASVALLPFAVRLLPAVGVVEPFHDWVLFPLTHYYNVPGNVFAPRLVIERIINLWHSGTFFAHPVSFTLWNLKVVALCAVFPLTLWGFLSLRRGTSRSHFLLLAVGLAAFVFPVFRRPGLINLEWALPLWAIAGVWCTDRLGKKDATTGKRLKIVALLFALIFSAAGLARIPSLTTDEGATLRTRTGTLRGLSPLTAARYRPILSEIDFELDEAEPLFTLGFNSMINFMSGHPNPTSFDTFLPPGYTPSSQVEKAISELESSRCRWIVRPRGFLGGKVWNSYLHSRYVPVYRDRSFELWKRKVADRR